MVYKKQKNKNEKYLPEGLTKTPKADIIMPVNFIGLKRCGLKRNALNQIRTS